MTHIKIYSDELIIALSKSTDVIVPSIGEDISEAGIPILSWINYLRSIHNNHSAIELLNGTQSALIETCAYCYLGLGRAAIISIRTQIDLLLCYTFFRDHPVEWKRVQRTGEGYRLFSEILKYHGEYSPDFKKRFEIINKITKPTIKELYHIMSAHIHAQSPFTVPTFETMSDLVLDQTQIESILDLQKNTSIAMSALLLAIYGNNWADLDPELYSPTRSIMKSNQAKNFFK